MPRYELTTAHYCARSPGAIAEWLPKGTVISHDGLPSVAMRSLDKTGEAARLRADLASNRLADIPDDWRNLPLAKRYELAVEATRTDTKLIVGGLRPGPKVTYANCDDVLEVEQTRRRAVKDAVNSIIGAA